MRHGRLALVLSLLAAAIVMLVGCGPRLGAESVAPAEDQLVISLPALVIDVDTDGNLSVGGTPLADLGAALGQDLSDLTFGSDTVESLISANIQHIQIVNLPDGLAILVNGQEIPSIGWTSESLAATGEVLELLDVEAPPLANLLPLIQNTGVGVTVRLPLAQGAELIPLVVEGDASAAAAASAAQGEFLAAVGTPPTLQLVVDYDTEGSWSVAGLTKDEWSELTGFPWEALDGLTDLVLQGSEAGISGVSIVTDPEGVFISVDDKTLPHLAWGEGRVNHLLNLAIEAGMLDGALGGEEGRQTMVDLLNALLPAIQASNVNITVNFP